MGVARSALTQLLTPAPRSAPRKRGSAWAPQRRSNNEPTSPFSKCRCSRRRPSVSAEGLAIPTTPELRDHQKIHHRKADEAGQKPLLDEAAHQPPRIQHADHQLSDPKDRHLDDKRCEGKTPFRCTEMKHSQPSTQNTQSADLPLKTMSSRPHSSVFHASAYPIPQLREKSHSASPPLGGYGNPLVGEA